MGFLSNLLNKLKGTISTESTPAAQQTTTATPAAPKKEEDAEVLAQRAQEDSAAAEHESDEHLDDAEDIEDEEVEDIDDDEKDDFGPYAHLNHASKENFEEFWYQTFQIEDAAMKDGDAGMERAFAERGIRNNRHFQQIRETFNRHFGNHPDYMQSMFNARGRQGKEKMQASVAGSKLFDPVEGVDIKTFATVYARIGQLSEQTPQALGKLLSEYDMDDAKWARVSEAWLGRMSSQEDPYAAGALATEYGKYFSDASQGKYATAAKAGAAAYDLHGAVGQAPDASTEPCSLEKYAEIMGAQAAWSEQGKDIIAMLKQTFDISIIDFSNLSTWWNAKGQSDYKLLLKIGDLQEEYKKRYLGGAEGADDDLTV